MLAHPAVTGAERKPDARGCADGTPSRPTTQHLPLPCPLGDHRAAWDLRRHRLTCRTCRIVLGGRETVDRLAADLAELTWYRQHLDVDHLRQPALGPKTRVLALAVRLLGEYCRDDGTRGAAIAANFRAAGLALPMPREVTP